LIQDEGLRVVGERRDGRYILKLAGKIDLSTVVQFEDALVAASIAPERVVVVDLSEVEYIDSTGLSALMESERVARGDADRIKFLAKFQPEVEAILRVSAVYDELELIEPSNADVQADS
jgi:anti-sigma B factor antagonist